MTNNLELDVEAKIVNEDWTNLEAGAKVAPINLWMHSLFNQVDVSLNNTVISKSNNTYAYRAYMETLLSYRAPAKESQLSASLWFKDTAWKMHLTTDENEGLNKRRELTAESKMVSMFGRLHSEMFCQDRYLLNGVDLRLWMSRNNSKFVLMADADEPKVIISAATLYVRKF